MADNLSHDYAYCAKQVRAQDRDRYLASLYVPDEARHHVLALYAFYNEIAKIPDLVSAAPQGEIRLLWWYNAVSDLYTGKTGDHPILRSLAGTIEMSDIERTVLLNMIDARRAILDVSAIATRSDFESYAQDTDGALIYLSARILLPLHAGTIVKSAQEAGLASALTVLAREISIDASLGRVRIPVEILKAHGLEVHDILQGPLNNQVRAMFDDILSWARAALERARDQSSNVPEMVFSVFLPLCFTDLYLKAMGAERYDPLRQTPQISRFRRQWRLMRSARKGIY